MTTIAQITVNDQVYKIRGVVDGFIIEFNERLKTHPEWLLQYVFDLFSLKAKDIWRLWTPEHWHIKNKLKVWNYTNHNDTFFYVKSNKEIVFILNYFGCIYFIFILFKNQFNSFIEMFTQNFMFILLLKIKLLMQCGLYF